MEGKRPRGRPIGSGQGKTHPAKTMISLEPYMQNFLGKFKNKSEYIRNLIKSDMENKK